jgi:hypothetical protein
VRIRFSRKGLILMPRLSTGRHVALGVNPYLDALSCGSDEQRYFAIAALRLHAGTPEALLPHVAVVYFVDGDREPPNAPAYCSDYSVADVLEGRSDWSSDEVEEFRRFISDDQRVRPWLETRFAEIDKAIRTNAVWESDLLVNDDDEADEISAAMIRRAIIHASAVAPDALAALRRTRYPLNR